MIFHYTYILDGCSGKQKFLVELAQLKKFQQEKIYIHIIRFTTED